MVSGWRRSGLGEVARSTVERETHPVKLSPVVGVLTVLGALATACVGDPSTSAPSPKVDATPIATPSPPSPSPSAVEPPGLGFETEVHPFEEIGAVPAPWIDGWYFQVSEVFGELATVKSVTEEPQRWSLSENGLSFAWQLDTGRIDFAPRVADLVLSSRSSIAVATGSGCDRWPPSACERTGGGTIIDSATGETVELVQGISPNLTVSADGTVVWLAGSWPELHRQTIQWSSGVTTTIEAFGDRVPTPDGGLLRPRMIAVSPDGASALFSPGSDKNGARPSQIDVSFSDGTTATVLGQSPTFAGGAAFSGDSASILLGTSEGLTLFDLSSMTPITGGLECDEQATWLRQPRDAVEISPGRWVVALTPSNLADPVAVAAIVDVEAATCEVFARVSPSDSTSSAGALTLALTGTPGSAQLILEVLDASTFGPPPTLAVDLDARPTGTQLQYRAGSLLASPEPTDGEWSVRPSR